jgi:hypothetical protein
MCRVHLVQFACGDQSLYEVTGCWKFVPWTNKETARKCGPYGHNVDKFKELECPDCSKWGKDWRSLTATTQAPRVLDEADGYKIIEQYEQ